MTSLSHYVWIYGLAEALALSLILTTLFGVGWWKLHQDRKKLELTCKKIAGMLKEDIDDISQKPTTRPELRNVRVSYLKTLAKPFKKRQLNDEQVWKDVLETLERSLDALMQTTRSASEPDHQALKITNGADAIHADSADTDELSADTLDSELDRMLAGYQAGKSAIETNREATVEMKRHYQELQLANQKLRQKLQVDKTSELWQAFDTYEQSNAAFMKTLSVKERSYNLLVKEYESLQEHIHNLQVTISNYRKSVHQLILERSTLTEENKQLLEQHEVTNRLVVRLNHNYDTLRNEYTKLFETTR
jgi:chromosome segregation ATPase